MNLAPESRPSISTMNGLGNAIARQVDVDDSADGQRIDNFLLRILKGVPRSHVYRLVRGGEVRVNSGRVDQTYRLRAGDRIRIPPVRVAQRKGAGAAQRITAAGRVRIPVLFEDEALLIVDKPAGCAVHGGSGVSFGVIEQLRAERPEARFLELVHRLDRDTSGVLVIAKRRAALTALHDIWRAGEIDKVYLAMVAGRWTRSSKTVDLPLQRYLTEDGERRVRPDRAGQTARTRFRVLCPGADATLLEAHLDTGRTHQIRVHLAHLGTPILGDEKYGDFALNKRLAKEGLGRMFLHARQLRFAHPLTAQPVDLSAPLPIDLLHVARQLLAIDDVPQQ